MFSACGVLIAKGARRGRGGKDNDRDKDKDKDKDNKDKDKDKGKNRSKVYKEGKEGKDKGEGKDRERPQSSVTAQIKGIFKEEKEKANKTALIFQDKRNKYRLKMSGRVEKYNKAIKLMN